MISALENNQDIKPFLYNDLEYAIFDDYPALQKIKKYYPDSIMSGSGSTYFVLQNGVSNLLGNDYLFIEGLKSIPTGVEIV